MINQEYKTVLYVTGVGSTALRDFTIQSGSSKYALEATNFYAMGSLQLLFERTIEKFVCQEVAEEMARRAYIRSHHILRSQNDQSESYLKTVGVGLTGAISSLKDRKGNDHAYLCFDFGTRKYTYYINLVKGRSREEEDQIISQILYDALIFHCQQNQGSFNSIFNQQKLKIPQKYELPQQDGVQLICLNEENDICLFDVLGESQLYHSILIDQLNYVINPIIEKGLVLSGSFNPPHQGHIELAQKSAQQMNYNEIFYELSIFNADKGKIPSQELTKRIHLMRGQNIKILISNRPLFKDKNMFLKNGAFSLGADTYKRLIDPKYYGGSLSQRDISFVCFVQNNNRFIVAPRLNPQTGIVEKLDDFEIPKIIFEHTLELPDFRNDESSTNIRKYQM